MRKSVTAKKISIKNVSHILSILHVLHELIEGSILNLRFVLLWRNENSNLFTLYLQQNYFNNCSNSVYSFKIISLVITDNYLLHMTHLTLVL